MKFFTFLALLFFGLQSCSWFSPDPKPLRIGINNWPGYEFFYLLDQKGFDKEFGVDVEVIQFASLSDSRRSFERGELDILATTPVEAILAKHNTKLDPIIYFAFDYSFGGDVILAKDPIKDIRGLKGKAVGLETGSMCLYALYRALQLNNMELSDVTIRKLDQYGIQQEFEKGTIDAVFSYPPYSISMLKRIGVKEIFNSRKIPFEPVDVLVSPRKILETRKKEIVALVKAFEKAKQYSFSEGTDGFELMAKKEGISTKDFETSLKNELVLLSTKEQRDFFFTNNKLQDLTDKTAEILANISEITDKNISSKMVIDLFHE